MRDWTEQPEASGPLSESDLARPGYGDPGMPSIGRIEPPETYPDLVYAVPAPPVHAEPAAEPAVQLAPAEPPVPDPAPDPDPSAAAIVRTIESEQAADAGKTVPEDATVVSS